ncbi:MAG: hypothetical protein ACRDZO_23675 [Egibacteraceae bacterium]
MTIADVWEKAGVRWCVLREGPPGATREVDMLVDRQDWPRVEAALRSSGYVPLPTWGRGTHRFFLLYEPASDSWTKLDIVTELAFGPYQELTIPRAAAECLRSAEGGRLSPHDAFWALLLHGVLDRQALSERQRRRLAELAPHATSQGALAGWVGTADEILASVRAGDWARVDTLGERLRAGRSPSRRALTRLLAARNRLVRKATRPLARFRRRAISVALLAPDGAGKSTLQQALASAWPLETWTAYLGLYPPDARRSLPGLAPAMRLARFWWRYAAGWVWQARGRLVIYDRHPIDALVLKDAPTGRKRRLERWVIAHACPLPDLVLVLDAPGAVLAARKPERAIPDLDAQRARYRAHAETSRAVLIDATADPDTVRRQATHAIWAHWSNRQG